MPSACALHAAVLPATRCPRPVGCCVRASGGSATREWRSHTFWPVSPTRRGGISRRPRTTTRRRPRTPRSIGCTSSPGTHSTTWRCCEATDPDAAVDILEESVQAKERANDEPGKVGVMHGRGLIAARQGQPSRAQTWFGGGNSRPGWTCAMPAPWPCATSGRALWSRGGRRSPCRTTRPPGRWRRKRGSRIRWPSPWAAKPCPPALGHLARGGIGSSACMNSK